MPPQPKHRKEEKNEGAGAAAKGEAGTEGAGEEMKATDRIEGWPRDTRSGVAIGAEGETAITNDGESRGSGSGSTNDSGGDSTSGAQTFEAVAPLEFFVESMQRIVEHRPATRFFVASNSPAVALGQRNFIREISSAIEHNSIIFCHQVLIKHEC